MWTARTNDDQRLILIKTGPVFDMHSLHGLLKQIYIQDEGKYAFYDRYVDVTGLETVDVDIDTLAETAQWYRDRHRPPNVVKIAFHSPFDMTGSLAQIYRLLSESDTMFNVKIFHSVVECAEYLQVDQSVLT